MAHPKQCLTPTEALNSGINRGEELEATEAVEGVSQKTRGRDSTAKGLEAESVLSTQD